MSGTHGWRLLIGKGFNLKINHCLRLLLCTLVDKDLTHSWRVNSAVTFHKSSCLVSRYTLPVAGTLATEKKTKTKKLKLQSQSISVSLLKLMVWLGVCSCRCGCRVKRIVLWFNLSSVNNVDAIAWVRMGCLCPLVVTMSLWWPPLCLVMILNLCLRSWWS